MVIKFTGLEEKIMVADYVFTGEGSIDSQTISGKTPYGVSMVAKKFNIPVIAFAGRIGSGIEPLYDCGINSIVGILPGAMDLETALKEGMKNMEISAENVTRILKIVSNKK